MSENFFVEEFRAFTALVNRRASWRCEAIVDGKSCGKGPPANRVWVDFIKPNDGKTFDPSGAECRCLQHRVHGVEWAIDARTRCLTDELEPESDFVTDEDVAAGYLVFKKGFLAGGQFINWWIAADYKQQYEDAADCPVGQAMLRAMVSEEPFKPWANVDDEGVPHQDESRARWYEDNDGSDCLAAWRQEHPRDLKSAPYDWDAHILRERASPEGA